jgi:hypothetical protein
MEQVHTETLGPVAADTWVYLTDPFPGPGTFVVVITCPVSGSETMSAAVFLNPEGAAPALVEEHTVGPTDLGGTFAGFQSSPVPLVDDTWLLTCRAKHGSAASQSFDVRVIKL